MNLCSVADVFVNATVEFLQNASMTAEPFYLFLSFTTPHAGGIGNVTPKPPCISLAGSIMIIYRVW